MTIAIHHLVPSDPIEADLRLPDANEPALYELAGSTLGQTPDANGVPPARFTDAWLYLGPAVSMSEVKPPPGNLDAAYVKELDRQSMIEWGDLRVRNGR